MGSTDATIRQIYNDITDVVNGLEGTNEEIQATISVLFFLAETIAEKQVPAIRDHWAARAYSIGDKLVAPGENQWTH